MPRQFDHRTRYAAAVLAAVLFSGAGSARSQTTPLAPSPSAEPGARPPRGTASDPVIGSVDGKLIYLSDLTRMIATLPEQIRKLPFDSIMPLLLDRMVDHSALALTARRVGLDKRPDVQRAMRAAVDKVLENALLAQTIPAQVTEAAIAARFNQQYANRPATDEVHARHILVGSEAEAKALLEELKRGADFAALARVASKDPDGRDGGDLGFFRRDQVWPGFADLAFSVQPGQVGPLPIHNEFGWHVVRVEERRLVAPPTLSEVHDQIRDDLISEAVRAVVADARSQMIIHEFNLDGSEAGAAPRLTRGDSDRSQ